MRALAGLFCCVALAGCASRSAPATLPTTPGALEALRRDLQSIFDDPGTAHAQWAVHVESLATAESLYSRNDVRYMIPASSQKLLSAAAAAEQLGWDYRFVTRVLSTAPVDADGTINGDLIIVGSGDPTINPRHPSRWRAFDDWALALKARGVRWIAGRIVGDDSAFAEPGWGFGWSWDDLYLGYGAAPSALQYHENQVELMIAPGVSVGSTAIIGVSPLAGDLVIERQVETVPAGAATNVSILRVPGTTTLSVRGRIAADAKPVTLYASVVNPTRFFVAALHDALARHGIVATHGIADVDELNQPLEHSTLHELVVDHSPPLIEIIDVALKWSRNIYAESLLLAIAPRTEAASASPALDVLRQRLRTWGIDPTLYLARDGSGLSRYNYVTARAMTLLLSYLWMNPQHADRFLSTLPQAGVNGTLANRMKGTSAAGRVWAKTGTMSNVRSLCGYATTLDGETIVFAMLANDFRVAAAEIDAIMDRALDRLVSFRRSPPTS